MYYKVQEIALILCLAAVAAPVLPQQQATSRPLSAADQKFVEATKLLQAGKADQARLDVLEGLKLNPRSAEGYNLLGMLNCQQNNFAQAEQAFERALALDPSSIEAHNNLGNCYMTERKIEAAEKELRATLQISPDNRDANYALGLLLLTHGKAEQAIPRFERVRPPDLATLLNLTQACLETGRKDQATKLVDQISTHYAKDVRAHFSLGVLLGAEKQYGLAVREFEIADALIPGQFEILYNLGQAYSLNKNQQKAEEVLKRALAERPDSAETMFLLGKLYFDQKRDLPAMEILLKAHKLAPSNTDIIFVLAHISMLQNYHEDAIPLLEEGIKINPNLPNLHAALGDCYFNAGKVDKAIEEFQTTIRLDPSAGSYAFMGLCYRHLGRFDEARKYFLEGLKRDPKNTSCLYNLGYMDNRTGNIPQAEDYLERALSADPNFGDALYELSSAKMTEKKFTEALPLLQKCVKVTTKPAEAYYKLATVERALHQKEAAERDLKIFETLAKNKPAGPTPFQNLFEYLDQRSGLAAPEQTKLDVQDLLEEVKRVPDEPKSLYLLAEAYLRDGQVENAKQTISRLDQISGNDFRTLLGVGVLLARYRLFPMAAQRFQMALAADPSSDDAAYDLANALFRMGSYQQALETLDRLSPVAQKEETALGLRGDLCAHTGRETEAVNIFQDAIVRNPDNDDYYLSLALAHLRAGDVAAAQTALKKGLAHIPNSGKILWGLGIGAVEQGDNARAEQYLKQCVELMPEWMSSYSVLAFFYYATGQISKARDTVKHFASENPNSPLNVQRIQQALDGAGSSETAVAVARALSPEERQQFLQFGLAMADEVP